MSRRVLLLAGIVVNLTVAGASAQDTLLWRSVGEWQVRIDKSVDYGCFMLASYTRGTVIRIGIDQQNRNGYVLIGNDAWRSLQVGGRYDMSLRFDNDPPWQGRATARTIGSGTTVFLYLSFDRPQFLVDLARKQNLTILYAGRVVTQLPLVGSFAATQELFACQRAADAARNNRPPPDPFSSGTPGAREYRPTPPSQPPGDPFAGGKRQI